MPPQPSLEDRQITVGLGVTSTSLADLRANARALASFFNSTDRKPLIFDDDTGKQWFAIVGTAKLQNDIVNYGKASIVFDCLPLAYDVADQTGTIGTPFTNNGTESIAEWTISGVMNTDASTIEINLVQSAVQIGYIKLSTTLVSGNAIIITSEDRRLKINGVDKTELIELTTVDWFDIPLGAVTLTCSQLTGTITYKRRYV